MLFSRKAPLPKRFCHLERLLAGMEARGLDGILVTSALNVFYLPGFNAIAHAADYYLGSFLAQPTWVEDIRPFRAVMMPLDRPPDGHGTLDLYCRDGGKTWVVGELQRKGRELYRKAGMVVPQHILYPGGEPFFGSGYGPL